MEKNPRDPKKNLKQARSWVIAFNFIAAICFLIVYSKLDDILFLIASILLFISSIIFFFILKYMERKFDKI